MPLRYPEMEMFLSDSDCGNFSDSSDSDCFDDIDSLYGGQAQSIFSNLERSIGMIDDLLAFERGFLHGDTVCSVNDPSGQLGRVVEVDMVVDLENIYGKTVKEVNSKTLLKIRSFVAGDYIVHGQWLGRVNRVIDRVTIVFDDGAKCEITAFDPETLVPISRSVIDDSQYPYYPGQRVRVRFLGALESTKWLCGAWKENRSEGMVCHLEAGLVFVDWVASTMLDADVDIPVPSPQQDSENLTLLSCFSHASWQLGDWCILQQKTLNTNFEELYVIVKRKYKVDVLWQDATHSVGLNSQSLFPVNNVGDHEFWPDQFVLEKGISDDPCVFSDLRVGIVKSVNAEERIVKLNWNYHAANRINKLDGESDETVSAYELIEHPDYSFCLGDIIFRSENIQNSLSLVQVDGLKELESHPNAEIGEGCLEFPYQRHLSCIGNVIDFKDGNVEVRWASGLTSKVAPHEIVGIHKNEDSAHILHEQDIDENSTQGATEYEQHWHHKEKDVLGKAISVFGEDSNKELWETSAFFLPRAAIGFFTSVATSLFGSHSSTTPSGSGEKIYPGGPSESYEFDLHGLPSESENAMGSLLKKEACKTLHNIEEITELQLSSSNKKAGRFKQFDMVGDLSDHHFVNVIGKGSMFPQVKRGWLKKVHQEWSILQIDLPATIFVRVYEERINLLRAAIVGAPGTPYHDGLFFFDFFLPSDYPNEPPLVHYNSGGLRLNPNLYESGRICLSLLNTWTGTGTETWNPRSSTILQVLLSLQALVLNEKPYFNEAGYDKQIGQADGEKNSITYNESTFLLCCKSMLYVLRKPPKHFETLVEEHFRSRSHSILLACEAYMDGAPVGWGTAEGETRKSCSTGFKIMLAKLFPKLVAGFMASGIDCRQFLERKNH